MQLVGLWRDSGSGPSVWPFFALALLVILLWAVGILPEWPGLVHLVALPPLGLFADQRILFSYATGYPTLLLGMLLSLLARTAFLAIALGGLNRRYLAFALSFNLLALPFGLLGAAALYASPATLFYALFWFGFGLLLIGFLLLAAVPWQAQFSICQAISKSPRQGFRLGTALAYFGILSLLGIAADLGGTWATVLLIVPSAMLTFVAARTLAVRPALVTARRTIGGVTAVGLVIPLLVVAAGPPAPPEAPEPGPPQPGSLLIMSGIDSASGQGAIFEIDPRHLGYDCRQTYYYSYAGPGDGAPQGDAFCPIRTGAPYGPEDTLRGSDDLVPFFHQQVADLESPVTVLTHSQGVWISWQAVAEAEDDLGVETLVLVGPFAKNRVSYPPDRDPAPGRVGTDVLFLLAEAARPGGTSVFDPRDPLAREYLAHPDRIQQVMKSPLPAPVDALSIPSAFDLPLLPSDWRITGATNACPVPVIHPNLPYAEELLETIKQFINDDEVGDCPPWRTILGPLGRPFSVPPNISADSH